MKCAGLVFSALISAVMLMMTSTAFAAKSGKAPHLEFDLRGSDYMKILAQRRTIKFGRLQDPDEATLKPVLTLGQKNLRFLNFINEHRDAAHKISLTSEATEQSAPIETPNVYNVAIVYQRYTDHLKVMPPALLHILTSDEPFPAELPMPEAEYIEWGLKTDHVYQIAARWLTLKPYLSEYAEARRDDIRGFYYLSREKDLLKKLAHWNELDANVQTQYQAWLLGTCFNTEQWDSCKHELEDLIANTGDASSFFTKYAPLSQRHYDSYFKLEWSRTDITFSTAHPEVLHIPFVDPKNAPVLNYLRDNIEDEWKWTGWNLRLDFLNGGDENTTSHIRWEEGVTPHVEVPNTIVMDQNQPMTEYESQWTIRHEFGHILGFPDCYIEFYDSEKAVMISYQLDTSNLMCSRRGHLKQTHVDELKRVYLH